MASTAYDLLSTMPLRLLDTSTELINQFDPCCHYIFCYRHYCLGI